jgi:hypothetical protein
VKNQDQKYQSQKPREVLSHNDSLIIKEEILMDKEVVSIIKKVETSIDKTEVKIEILMEDSKDNIKNNK